MKFMNQKGISSIVIILIIIGVFVIAGGVWYWQSQKEKPVACTQDTKLCPDGSYVSRTGPNCEFAACPEAKDETANWKTYRNEEYGFEVKYPNDWQITEDRQSGVMNIISFRGVPGSPGDNLSIAFMPNQGGITIDEWWAEKSKNSDFKKTGETKIAGRKALELNIPETVPPAFDRAEGSRYIFISQDRDGSIFQITISWLTKDLTNQILSTFKFLR